MTSTLNVAVRRLDGSILVMSPCPQIAATVSEAFPEGGSSRVKIEPAQVAALNGQATTLAARHDVVIFEARSGDRAEFDAISVLAAARPAGTLFIALAEGDLSIAEARKLREAGVGEVLPNTIGGPELRQAIDGLLAARRAPEQTEAQGTLIAVAQARGGIGSTSVAVNLARKLIGTRSLLRAPEARRVALVDFDLQFGNAGVFLDLEGSGLLDLMEAGGRPDPTILEDAIQTHDSGLRVIGAPVSLVPMHALSAETVEGLLDALVAQHDAVVIDLPRALLDWLEPVIRRVTRMVVVTDTSVLSIRQARRLIAFYRETNPDIAIEIVVNRARKPLFKTDQIREAERVLELPLRHWLPDAPREAYRAAEIGRPVVDLHPRSRLSRAYGRLAAALTPAIPSRQHATPA